MEAVIRYGRLFCLFVVVTRPEITQESVGYNNTYFHWGLRDGLIGMLSVVTAR